MQFFQNHFCVSVYAYLPSPESSVPDRTDFFKNSAVLLLRQQFNKCYMTRIRIAEKSRIEVL
jgi:hypothetical protein